MGIDIKRIPVKTESNKTEMKELIPDLLSPYHLLI